MSQKQKQTVEISDVEIPKKSVDVDAGLDARLTDNVQNRIGPARYFERDGDGNAVESWGGVFDRVASNVAEAEYEFGGDRKKYQIWKHQFEKSMRELRFMPNSPTLMNAGLPLQQLSACIAGDAPVYTRSGLKPMASVEVGDEVLTHEGRFKEVTAHWSNGVKDTIELNRGSSRRKDCDSVMTPDHKVLSESGDWVRADEVEDAVQPTADPNVAFPDIIDLTQYTRVMNKEKSVVSVDGSVRVENSDDPRTGEYDQQYSEITSHVVNDTDLAWLFGAYIAEGDVDGSDTRFTIGADEDEFREKIVSTIENVFDTNVAVSDSNHGQWTTISVSSPFIADLFRTQIGTGVTEKRIPEWVFAGNDEYQQALLDGIITGDGTVLESGTRIELANPTLVYEASLIARNLGKSVNFKLDRERSLSANETSQCYISTSERTALNNVDKTDGERVEVFDMEVEDDHSFVVGDFVVHNCFVVEPGDDMDEINEAQSDAAAIFKSGGGVGYAFHHLRPKGARVSSTGGVSSGPLSFMQLYDTTCDTVKQGGKRRGAQMAIMHCQHPDIGRFAVSKRGEDNFTNFNISYGVTDEFKEAVENDDTFVLYDPTTRPSEDHDLGAGEPFDVVAETAHFYDPQFEDAWNEDFDKPGVGLDGKPVEENFWRDYADTMQTDFSEFRDRIDLEPGEPLELPARFVWQLLIDGAHNNGEPGIFYLDETNRQHSFDVEEHPEHRVHATNPCSEQPLEEHEACNLGHVNLSLMVDETAPTVDEFEDRVDPDEGMERFTRAYLNRAFDDEVFEETVRVGTRFLDNVVTQSEFPLESISEQVRAKRKIGLGLMGFHQMLVQMGVEYGSDLSYEIARETMRRIDSKATEVSHELAQERGTFEEWSESKWSDPASYPDWFETHAHQDPARHEDGYAMRNHNVTTIAPTGTTSMIGNTTGGCEPIYQVAYFKNVGDDIQGDQMLVEFDDYFLQTLEANDIDVESVKDEAQDLMMNNEFDGVDDLDTVPDEIGELFVTTQDLDAEQHIRMQAAFQEYCDSGISKTLNLPADASVDEVGDAFLMALNMGIKGCTVYRDGSRDEQVKTTRLDNKIDSDSGEINHLLEQLDGETAKNVLDQLEEDIEYERECDECGSTTLDMSEGCPVCLECGYSVCSS